MINIADKTKCAGCAACYSVCPKNCISMIEDEEGFLYPVLDTEKCIHCDACGRVCPLKEDNNKKYGIISSYIIQNKNEDILRQSTSGGGFTPIAEYILKREGVVFGVEMDKNFFVKHVKITNDEELALFRNSKYVQSYVGDTFKEAKRELDKGKLVCFSGTPCQIQGLKNYLREDYENLVTVDVVCRGVPSPGIWSKYNNHLKSKGKIKEIVFRDKELGYQYSTMKVEYENGKTERNGIESDQWLRMFFSGMILRPSCTKCNFRSINRCSDFTIWDCFNVSDLTKELDETKGATRMLIHTQKGLELFYAVCNSFNVTDTSVEMISSGISTTVIENKRKDEFINDYHEMDMESLLNKWFPMSFKVLLMKNVRLTMNRFGIDRIAKKLKRRIKGC